jgi:cytochrome oxidase Cu insertion factor (SCO1/SenC/PrrC family)
LTALRSLAAALLLGCGAAAAAAPAADPDAKARAWFTDTVLVTEEGERVRFYSDVLAGRVVVVDFVFTRCIGACPLLTSKLLQLRRALGDASREVRFVSISVDPGFDTPAELKRFATKHGADDAGWTWLTGDEASLREVLRRLGGWVDRPEEHSTRFLVGNLRTARWTKVRSDLPAQAIAAEVRRVAESPGAPAAAAPAEGTAPAVAARP